LLPSLPLGYIEYVKATGPFECFTRDDAEPGYVVLWALEDISRINSEVEIEIYAPGFVAFGGNGGGEFLVLDSTGKVFMLPMIGMEPECAMPVAETFEELAGRFDV
jgi:hypothetical protein